MSIPRTVERRVLAKDEFEIVDRTHHPKIKELSEKELRDTITHLRRLRDKARDLSRGQTREIRGKTDARGTRPARTDDSQRFKKQIFANALRRANAQHDRLA